MITRAVNTSLCIAVIVGLFYTAKVRSERNGLRREHDALAGQFGSLDIQDPEKFYLVRLATDDPFEFSWRVYQPEQDIRVTHSSMMGGSGWTRSSASAGEGLMRLRFRWEEHGTRVFFKHLGGSSTSGIGNRGLADFLRSHWRDLEFTTSPVGEQQVYDPDQVIEVMTIAIPESLHQEARVALGQGYQNEKIQPLLQIHMGGEAAFAEAKERP